MLYRKQSRIKYISNMYRVISGWWVIALNLFLILYILLLYSEGDDLKR